MEKMTLRQSRKAIADRLAIKWDVAAPFPLDDAVRSYITWKRHNAEIDFLKRRKAALKAPSAKELQAIDDAIASWTRRRDKLKVPKPYLSWAHLCDFWEEGDG